MSLLYVDGFEWCANTTDLNYIYTVFQNNPWAQSSPRVTGSSLTASFASSTDLTLNFGNVNLKSGSPNITSWVIGMGFKKPSNCTGAIFSLKDFNSLQCEVRINTDQTLSVTRNGTTVTKSSFSLLNGVWYFIEWKVTISSSIASSSCIVKVDEVEVINVPASSNLQNTANNYAQALVIGQWNASCSIDDLYICDQSGASNNDFLGDTRITTLYPDGNGNTNQWSVVGAASNYQAVDDATPDGDTSYVYSTTPFDVDLYTYQNVTATSVAGLQTRHVFRRDNTDINNTQPVLRINSTNYNGFMTHVQYNSYSVGAAMYNTNPDTTVAWTPSDVNSIEAGLELVT